MICIALYPCTTHFICPGTLYYQYGFGMDLYWNDPINFKVHALKILFYLKIINKYAGFSHLGLNVKKKATESL
jgi:hypothetical protein